MMETFTVDEWKVLDRALEIGETRLSHKDELTMEEWAAFDRAIQKLNYLKPKEV